MSASKVDFNILAYGAQGDGNADCTHAILLGAGKGSTLRRCLLAS
jgi:hypothetical protein